MYRIRMGDRYVLFAGEEWRGSKEEAERIASQLTRDYVGREYVAEEIDVRKIVRDNLTAAIEGGYSELRNMSSSNIAVDMITLASDCNEFSVEELVPFINEFFHRK